MSAITSTKYACKILPEYSYTFTLGSCKYVLQYLQGMLEEEIGFSTTLNDDLQLFTNIDITHLLLLERHISWNPHWNQIMACSSYQFEIYSMDECTKQSEM